MNEQEVLAKLQAVELEILDVVGGFCEAHGIQWFLDGGTALGARRHAGFIPWDDDVDIAMLREDYDRFVGLAREGLPEGYSLHDASNTPGYAGMFAKVYKDGTSFQTKEALEAGCDQAIFVDVFPYDAIAQDGARAVRQVKNARLWQSVSYVYHAKTVNVPHKGVLGSIERAGCRLLHVGVRAFLNPQAICRRFERSRLQPGEASSGAYLELAWPNMEPLPEDALVPPVPLPFEGRRLPVPRQTERYLENMYGDWRKIPDPQDRHTHFPLKLDFGDGTTWSANQEG